MGGAERVVEMLAESQVRHGHEVGVAYMAPASEPFGERHGVATFPIANTNLLWIDETPSKPAALRVLNKAWTVANPRTSAAVDRIVSAWRPDVVHSHSMVIIPPAAWRSARATAACLVHTLHDYDLLCLKSTLFKGDRNCAALHPACAITARWKASHLSSLDAVVGVSAAVLTEHERRGVLDRIAPERRSVIWNGVGIEQRTSEMVPPARSRDFTFGFMGRLMPEKGLDVLLEACRRLPPSGWRLRVAGRPRGDSDYVQRSAGLPVEFCGFVEAGAFMDSLDVLVVPPVWREPFGLTVVEALARGVPVLGSSAGAVAELVERSGLGAEWIVPAGDAAALGERMGDLIGRGRQQLPSASSFAALFDAVAPDTMTASYLDLYGRLLSGRAKAE